MDENFLSFFFLLASTFLFPDLHQWQNNFYLHEPAVAENNAISLRPCHCLWPSHIRKSLLKNEIKQKENSGCKLLTELPDTLYL